MKKHEAAKIRRIILKLTKEQVAEEAEINVKYIEFYEDGKNIGRSFENKIWNTLYVESKKLGELEHYKFRILELAMKIQLEDNKDILVKNLAHMVAECGKYQMDLMDLDGFLV